MGGDMEEAVTMLLSNPDLFGDEQPAEHTQPAETACIEEAIAGEEIEEDGFISLPVESSDGDDEGSEWDELLVELQEMGFSDRSVNQEVLAEVNGDVKDAVKALVQRERA